MAKTLKERLYAKIRVGSTGECWPWTGGKVSGGYGLIRTGGRGLPKRMAHAVAWELNNGPVPEGFILRHRCDNPSCCNPLHLVLGTHQDNMTDRQVRGRAARGERHGSARFSVDEVLAIRADTRPYREIARDLDVHHSTIRDIARRKTWAHVA